MEYLPIAEEYKIPIVVTGFEPVDILFGIHKTVQMLEEGRHGVENAYSRCVTKEGNAPALELLREIFEPCARDWRGIGHIPGSGYRLRDQYRRFDAEHVFDLRGITVEEPVHCLRKILGIKTLVPALTNNAPENCWAPRWSVQKGLVQHI
jgi:hydrogenase expression/formation protein HypD